MERRELKRFDDTPTLSLKTLSDRVLSRSTELQYNIYNIVNIVNERKRCLKTTRTYHWREPLFSNFIKVARRVHPEYSITALIECFFEAYIKAFGRYANANITLFQPLDLSLNGKGEIEGIIERAEEREILERLKIQLKILEQNPNDLEEKRNLRRLLLSHRDFLKSTRNMEVLELLKRVEAYL